MVNASFAADLRRAEAECAREPIARPGAIQPAGMLHILDATTGRAIGRSANACALAPADASRLAGALATAGAASGALGEVHTVDGRRWTATLHRASDAVALLELEPGEDPEAAARALDHLGAVIDALAAAPDVGAAAGAAATHLRAMTGFDRVMVYRFAPDWSGEVIAESRAAAAQPGGGPVDSFHGLRFPASDIPPQARALYHANRVRLIADARGEPVTLVADGDTPLDLAQLDLGRASLRAVSPVHLAYLANMGVRASMSVAISRDGELWGLLACHHVGGPHLVGHRARQAAETLGRALAWRIAELEESEASRRRASLGRLPAELRRALDEPDATLAAALGPLGDLLRGAAGSATFVLLRGDLPLFACAAAGGELPVLPGGLGQGLAANGDGFDTECLAGETALGALGPALAAENWSGLLGRRISADGDGEAGDTWAVWLRRDLPGEVVWAGNPEKNLAVPAGSGAQPVLSPRHSFAAWQEEAHGRSAPFRAPDRAGADFVRDGLREALLQRAQAAAAHNEELRRRNGAIRFFADAAVHDLREPLWQIQVFAGALRADLPGGSDGADLASVIEAAAGRMRDMLDDLAEFAAADVELDQPEPVALGDVMAEAAADIAVQLRAAGAELTVDLDGVPPVPGNRASLRRVFQNLLSNAVKYRRPDATLRIAVDAVHAGGAVCCTVRDNGSGFDRAHRERIFHPFLRLDHAGAAPSEGLGLGLAICRRIVEAHGGTIVADGSPGAGARFELRFPLEGLRR